MPHDEAHEAMLRAALLGEIPPDDPRATALERCEHCRARYAELLSVTDSLAEVARTEREVLSMAADDEDRALAAAALGRLAEREPHRVRARRPPPIWAWWVAAAAALVLGFLALRPEPEREPKEPREPLWIGDAREVVLASPLGEVDGFERFSWSYDPDHRYGFDLHIRDADAPPDAEPVRVVRDLSRPEWIPNEHQRATLPTRVRWFVDALDASGRVQASSAERSAWLSR